MKRKGKTVLHRLGGKHRTQGLFAILGRQGKDGTENRGWILPQVKRFTFHEQKIIRSRVPQTLQSSCCSHPSASSRAFPSLQSRTPAQQPSVAPSPTAPKALPGCPSLTKEVTCLLISSSQKQFWMLTVPLQLTKDEQQAGPLSGASPWCSDGRETQEEETEDRDPLFLPCSLPDKPWAPAYSILHQKGL